MLNDKYYIEGTIAIMIFLRISEFEAAQIGNFDTNSNSNMQTVLKGLTMSEFTLRLAARCNIGKLWNSSPKEFFSDRDKTDYVFVTCLKKLGSNEGAFYISLLGFVLKHNYSIDYIGWPDGFINDNLKKSAKTLSKFNA